MRMQAIQSVSAAAHTWETFPLALVFNNVAIPIRIDLYLCLRTPMQRDVHMHLHPQPDARAEIWLRIKRSLFRFDKEKFSFSSICQQRCLLKVESTLSLVREWNEDAGGYGHWSVSKKSVCVPGQQCACTYMYVCVCVCVHVFSASVKTKRQFSEYFIPRHCFLPALHHNADHWNMWGCLRAHTHTHTHTHTPVQSAGAVDGCEGPVCTGCVPVRPPCRHSGRRGRTPCCTPASPLLSRGTNPGHKQEWVIQIQLLPVFRISFHLS